MPITRRAPLDAVGLSKILAFRAPKVTMAPVVESMDNPTEVARFTKFKALSTDSPFYWKRPGFEAPKVNFAALREACKTEPFFKQRSNRFQNLMWKNGYTLSTKDDAALEYIRARMEIATLLSRESFDSFMRRVSRELIQFDNVLLWERRFDAKTMKKLGLESLGLTGVGKNKSRGPALFYEILPMETIRFARDNNNNVSRWYQLSPNGETKDYDPSEVILIRKDPESGELFAYPTLQMVIPDARIMRQLETDASLVAHRLAYPLFKYKVGDPKVEQSIPRKNEDLSDLWFQLEGMLLDGTIIMPGTHDFEVVLSDAKMEGLKDILDYFKNRVIVSMGLSPVHLGDIGSANRSITDRLDVQLYDDVKGYQKVFSESFTYFIFSKWLMEGGFNVGFGRNTQSESFVELEFREIDTDSLIKRQNHTGQLWTLDMIGHDEMRKELGRTPLGEDTSELYSDKIGSINAKYQKEVDQSKAQEAQGGSGQGSNAKTKATKTSGLGLPGPTSFRELDAILSQYIAVPELDYILAQWDGLKDACLYHLSQYGIDTFEAEDLDYLHGLFIGQVVSDVRAPITMALSAGIDRGFSEARGIDPDVPPMPRSSFTFNVEWLINSITNYLDSLVLDMANRVERNTMEYDSVEDIVDEALDNLRYRFRLILLTHIDLADNWGVALVAEHAGYEQVYQESEIGCNLCQGGWISLINRRVTEVPPFSTHPNCSCRLHIMK